MDPPRFSGRAAPGPWASGTTWPRLSRPRLLKPGPGQLSGHAPWPRAKSWLFSPSFQSQVTPPNLQPNPWLLARPFGFRPRKFSPHPAQPCAELVGFTPFQASSAARPRALLPPSHRRQGNRYSPGPLWTRPCPVYTLILQITQTVSEKSEIESQALCPQAKDVAEELEGVSSHLGNSWRPPDEKSIRKAPVRQGF